MDQDITKEAVITLSTSAAVTTYIVAPYRCTLRDVLAVVDADPGDEETLTIKDGDDTLGVVTFGTDIAAGAKGVFALDETNGKKIIDAGDVLSIVASQATAAANAWMSIEFDPYARTA